MKCVSSHFIALHQISTFSAFSLHLHFITLHGISSYFIDVLQFIYLFILLFLFHIHSQISSNFSEHITFHHASLHFITFHYINFYSFHQSSLHFITFHYINFYSFHQASLHFITFHYINFYYFIRLHHISSHLSTTIIFTIFHIPRIEVMDEMNSDEFCDPYLVVPIKSKFGSLDFFFFFGYFF